MGVCVHVCVCEVCMCVCSVYVCVCVCIHAYVDVKCPRIFLSLGMYRRCTEDHMEKQAKNGRYE